MLRFCFAVKIYWRILALILENVAFAKWKLYLSKKMGKDQLDKLEPDGPITLRI